MRFLRHCSIAALFIWLLDLLPPSAVAQQKLDVSTSRDPHAVMLRQELQVSVRRFADNTLHAARRYNDSLRSAVSAASSRTLANIDVWVDSLLRSAHDSLDASRRDTLRMATKSLQRHFLAITDTIHRAVRGTLVQFTGKVSRANDIYSLCDTCTGAIDFAARFAGFRDFVDDAEESFHDTASTLSDDCRDVFDDQYEVARDSLADLRDQLIQNRLDEIDYQRYKATRLIIAAAYSGHSSYRGRDNGASQQMITPSLRFCHSSGLSLQAAISWDDQTTSSWNGATATAAYEFVIGTLIGGGVSYNHFWFSDSSRSSEAVFKDAFDVVFSLNLPVVALSVDANLATGTSSEFTLAILGSHDFQIPLSVYDNLSLQPTLTAIIGEQNSSLTTIRTKGAKGKKVVGVASKDKNTFGILDYEISLPATINLGPVAVLPSLNYIIPLNVIDLSTSRPFLNFELGLSLTFH